MELQRCGFCDIVFPKCVCTDEMSDPNEENRIHRAEMQCEMCDTLLCSNCCFENEGKEINGVYCTPYPGEYWCMKCLLNIKSCKRCFTYLMERMEQNENDMEPYCNLFPHNVEKQDSC